MRLSGTDELTGARNSVSADSAELVHPQVAQSLGKSDNGGEALASPFSHQSVPLTAHNLPLRLPEWNIYLRKRAAEVYLMKLHALHHK